MKEAIEVRFDRPPIHPHDLRYFCVTAALQEQINDLLLSWTQPHGFRHCVLQGTSIFKSVGRRSLRRLDELYVNLGVFPAGFRLWEPYLA
jgi:hypothetical protein